MRLKDAKIGFLGGCFRVCQTLFFMGHVFRGLRYRLTPGYKHSGFALGVQPFRLDTIATAAVIKNRDYHKHSTDKHSIV